MKLKINLVAALLVVFSCFMFIQRLTWSQMEEVTPSVEVPDIKALRTHPELLTLEHARDGRRVLVSGQTKDGKWVDVTSWGSVKTCLRWCKTA